MSIWIILCCGIVSLIVAVILLFLYGLCRSAKMADEVRYRQMADFMVDENPDGTNTNDNRKV